MVKIFSNGLQAKGGSSFLMKGYCVYIDTGL